MFDPRKGVSPLSLQQVNFAANMIIKGGDMAFKAVIGLSVIMVPIAVVGSVIHYFAIKPLLEFKQQYKIFRDDFCYQDSPYKYMNKDELCDGVEAMLIISDKVESVYNFTSNLFDYSE